MRLTDTQYALLGDMDALRAAFAEQIAHSAAATAKRGGPVRSTRARWSTWHEGDEGYSYERPEAV
jgi:hypothetical protein